MRYLPVDIDLEPLALVTLANAVFSLQEVVGYVRDINGKRETGGGSGAVT